MLQLPIQEVSLGASSSSARVLNLASQNPHGLAHFSLLIPEIWPPLALAHCCLCQRTVVKFGDSTDRCTGDIREYWGSNGDRMGSMIPFRTRSVPYFASLFQSHDCCPSGREQGPNGHIVQADKTQGFGRALPSLWP